MTPLLTIFTAPKPFTHPHIAMIQRNALKSWLALGDAVQVVVIGEESGLAETAAEFGVLHLPHVERNSYGTPLIRSIFQLARDHTDCPYLGFVNTDILLLPDFVQVTQQAAARLERFLLVGQRWDLDVREPLDFSAGWDERIRSMIRSSAKLHPAGGSDYFIFPRACFQDVPPMAVGRAGWDNWMIYEGRRQGMAVVDATGAINIAHQQHDYAHLPGGQPHYRLPETDENIRLGGGKLTIFRLNNCNYRMENDQPVKQKLDGGKFWREVEIFPLVRLHSMALGWVSFAIFHPKKAWNELRVPLSKLKRKLLGRG